MKQKYIHISCRTLLQAIFEYTYLASSIKEEVASPSAVNPVLGELWTVSYPHCVNDGIWSTAMPFMGIFVKSIHQIVNIIGPTKASLKESLQII